MSTNQSPRGKKETAAKRLAEALAAIDSDDSFMSVEDNQMLSLMVDETLKGVDITIRYPAFYQKLLGSAELRQAFLDTLESLESEKNGQMLPLPAKVKPDLAFLSNQSAPPGVEKLDEHSWKISWGKSIEQLQALFFPPKLAYRSDASLFDDAWFTLLRSEVELDGTVYSVLLECGSSKEKEDALSASLNLAISLAMPAASLPVVHATLHWGNYHETRAVSEEGRARFPDIPFALAFDRQAQRINAGLDLTLEIGS